MEEVNHTLFNSTVETGVRTLVVLNAAYPKKFDLSMLTLLDHLVVHTGDLAGGPPSLHPDVPQRNGELLVRRRLIEESLKLMLRLHLVNISMEKSGIMYIAGDNAFAFVELMRTKYAKELKEKAEWLSENVITLSEKQLKELIAEKIGKWNVEFQNNN